MKIEKIKLFVNNSIKARKVAKIVKEKLESNGFSIVDDEFQLGIAIGGDGSFLRMIKNSNFADDCFYVGINAGTLGFAQEITVNNLDLFIKHLKNEEIFYEEIGVLEVEVTTKDSVSRFCSLNEMVVRDEELNTLKTEVYIDDVLLENYAGDGLLVASSFGSTAYNLSFGGSLVYNTFKTLQITPIAPLNNRSYRNLLNSVIIPDKLVVKLLPQNDNLLISVDGDNNFYNEVLKIEVKIDEKTIKIIRSKDYNFVKKVNEKFLK